MDISKDITYRGLSLNDAALDSQRTLKGIAIDTVDYSDVQAVGYTEKRAAADGMHASDVYLGARGVDISGHIYAADLGELFDSLHRVRSVFSPTSAYQESPGDRGFLPLRYQQPTKDTDSFPSGVIPLYLNVRPVQDVRFTIGADRLVDSKHGNGARPTAIPWGVRLIAKDPRVYIDPATVYPLVGGPFSTTTAAAVNRGDYETPLNILLAVGAAPGAVKNFHIWGLNGIDLTITIENIANVIYRWFGDDRVLMTEDVSGGPNTKPLVLRMDLALFATKNRRPMVPASINPPARPFSTQFTYSSTGVFGAGSRLFWSEAFA